MLPLTDEQRQGAIEAHRAQLASGLPRYWVSDTMIEEALENLRLDRPHVLVSVGNLLRCLRDARAEIRRLEDELRRA